MKTFIRLLITLVALGTSYAMGMVEEKKGADQQDTATAPLTEEQVLKSKVVAATIKYLKSHNLAFDGTTPETLVASIEKIAESIKEKIECRDKRGVMTRDQGIATLEMATEILVASNLIKHYDSNFNFAIEDSLGTIIQDAQIDLDKRNQAGKTALDLAEHSGKQTVVNILLNAEGVNPVADYLASSNIKPDDQTPATLVASIGNMARAIKDAAEFKHFSTQRCERAMGKVIQDSFIDLDMVDAKETTALNTAAQANSGVEACILLAAGANPNIPNIDNTTPLMWFAWHNNIDTVRALIKAKADVNILNKLSHSALFLAVYRNHKDVAQALVIAGATVDENLRQQLSPEMSIAINQALAVYEQIVKRNSVDRPAAAAAAAQVASGRS